MKSLLLLLFLSAFVGSVHAQGFNDRMLRVKSRSIVQKQASPLAVSSLVAFIDYVKKSDPDITRDLKSQTRWLSKSLRKEMMDAYAREAARMNKNPEDKPEYPDNASFTGVWNQPTYYSIVSAREYDYRNAKNPNSFRTVIDVLYEWGKEDTIDNQYPGVRNLRSYIFIKEDGLWKLDDIYGFGDEFTGSESLRQYFATSNLDQTLPTGK